MEEIWKDIPGFDGLYQVSNLGRVKSLPKKIWNGKGYFISKEKLLKPNTLAKGYFQVELKKNLNRCCFQVHRLVAMAFIQNPFPESYDQINHINGDKQDNRVENLEWSNNSLNQKHAWATGLQRVSNKAGKPRRRVRLYNSSESIVFGCVAEIPALLQEVGAVSCRTRLRQLLQGYECEGLRSSAE